MPSDDFEDNLKYAQRNPPKEIVRNVTVGRLWLRMVQSDCRRERKDILYNKVTEKDKSKQPVLRKACKIAIKLLRLKTIKKLKRLKETSNTRKEVVDKLEKLRKLDVNSILKAMKDRNFVANICSDSFLSKEIYSDILRDKRVLEAMSQVSKKGKDFCTRQWERRRAIGSLNKSSRTPNSLKSVFLDSLNGEMTSSIHRQRPSRNLSDNLAFFESSDLHPSWKAKRWKRQWESSFHFQGRHIYF